MTLNIVKSITGRISMGGYNTLERSWWHGENIIIDDSKLFYITDGEILIEIGNEELFCRAGELVLIPASTKHSYRIKSEKSASKFWCHFSLCEEGESIFDKYDMPIRVPVATGQRKQIEELFFAIIDEREGDTVAQCKKMSHLFQLVHYFLSFEGCKEKKSVDTELDSVLKYINENLHTDITLSELASVACLSPNYLVRKFRAKLGVPPLKYVHMMKMEKAKKLLLGENARIYEVMAQTGFDDASYFSRAFKSYTGCSPRIYRRVMTSEK